MSVQNSSSIRSQRARIAAHEMHAQHDSRITSAPGREAAKRSLEAKLLAQIDEASPGLPDAERLRRLEHARKAHYARLALASAKARSGGRSGVRS